MTARNELAAILQRNEAAAVHGFMASDPVSRRRFGFTPLYRASFWTRRTD